MLSTRGFHTDDVAGFEADAIACGVIVAWEFSFFAGRCHRARVYCFNGGI
jgi:hypothetical protein